MRILIVDDHELVRSGVRTVLRRRTDFDICGEAVDGQDAVEKARQLHPDVIVMDVSMPKMNGIDATREIQHILPQTAVLVLSQHDSPEMMRQALNAGAKGYVVKSAISANLIDGINKVGGGEMFFDPAAVKEPGKSGDQSLEVQEILKRSEAFEKALRESEERFRLTFQQAAVGMAHVAPDGRWLRVNQKLCEIVGYTPQELEKITFQQITYPPDLQADLAQLKNLLAGKTDRYSIEKRYIRKDGSLVWVNLSVSAVRDSDHNVKYFVSIVEDISARKHAEARLVASDERLRALLEDQMAIMQNMAEGVYTLDAQGHLTSMNPAAEAMFGWTCAELLGKKMHDVIHYKHPDGRAFPTGECRQLAILRNGFALRDHEETFIRKDGSFMPVICSWSPMKRDGKIVGAVIGFRDDSEEKEAREALRSNERQLQNIIDALPAAVYTTDAEGRLTHYNPAAAEFSGREPKLGDDQWCVTWKLFRPDGTPLPHDQCPMALALKELPVEDGIETIAERPDGTRRWFKPYPRALRDADGKIVGGVNMLVDTTDQKEAQRASSLLAAVVDSTDDAIVSKTPQGIITSWNKAAERLFGYTAKEATGQSILLIIPPERHEEESEILARIARGERIDHFETVRRRKDGSLIDVSLTISPVLDDASRVIGASKIARDITIRKQADKTLAASLRQQTALFHLADGLNRAASAEEIYDVAFQAIFTALSCDRAAVLLADAGGSPRFVAWRGLSEAYRKAVDGHSAWKPGDPDPQPVCIEDIDTAAEISESLKATVKLEGIRALSFIPLVSGGRLMGKFMTYFDIPHTFAPDEIDLSLTVARQISFAIDRMRSGRALLKSEERLRTLTDNLDAEVRARTSELEVQGAEIVEQSEMLRDLTARLMQAQDDERRRIARELHDSVGQILTVLGLHLGSLATHAPALPADVSHTIEQSERLLDQLNREIRTMSYLLHPPLLDESGLTEALRWYVSGLQQRSKIDIDLEIPEHFERLAPETELAIFRVIQEALTNIHRHSHSEMALIRLTHSGANIGVEIQDWGDGIPPERLKQIQSQGAGVGIRGMRERVHRLHGDFTIESDESGTKISMIFPASVAVKRKSRIEVEPLANQESA